MLKKWDILLFHDKYLLILMLPICGGEERTQLQVSRLEADELLEN